MRQFGNVAMWRCGDVAMRRCGNVAIWQCGNEAMWQCGNEAIGYGFGQSQFSVAVVSGQYSVVSRSIQWGVYFTKYFVLLWVPSHFNNCKSIPFFKSLLAVAEDRSLNVFI